MTVNHTVALRTIDVPIVFSADEARQICEKLLYRAWTEREQFEFYVGIRYVELSPGDVVQLEVDGNVHIVRIQSVDFALPGVLRMRGVSDRASLYSSSVSGGTIGYLKSSVVYIGDTIFEVLDLPALQASDLDTAGYYVAMYGDYDSWTGGMLYRSLDNGATWAAVLPKNLENKIGLATTALANYETRSWDTTGTVEVVMSDGATLTSDTTDNLLLDETINRAVIGNEIIAFATATLTAANTYTLSNLLRGLGGTEHEIGNHSSNERFVVLDSTLGRVGSNYNQLGNSVLFKALSDGQYLEDVQSKQVTFDNLNSKPWSVVQLRGSRDVSNNLTIDWVRRSRAEATMLWTPVLQEESEEYQVEIHYNSVLVRTVVTSLPTYTYDTTQQVSDGVTPGDVVIVKVYQVSATVGRGYVSEETL